MTITVNKMRERALQNLNTARRSLTLLAGPWFQMWFSTLTDEEKQEVWELYQKGQISIIRRMCESAEHNTKSLHRLGIRALRQIAKKEGIQYFAMYTHDELVEEIIRVRATK